MTIRRNQVPFDPYYFERLARQGMSYSPREAFDYIYRNRHWAGKESVSGEGASQDQTAQLRAVLPRLLREFETHTLLDLPCGDFSWMREVTLPVAQYVGADLLPALIAEHQARYADDRRCFLVLDLTVDALPPADVLLCRDCLVHLSFADVARALANIKRGHRLFAHDDFPQLRSERGRRDRRLAPAESGEATVQLPATAAADERRVH